ncbi:MAG: glycosyltransferase family 2 protein [Chloroflexi bacterium]|nr:glycosyltransferase family 2 protein [Chloroflexota bacterium]
MNPPDQDSQSLVSVIVPVFNGVQFLPEAVDSIRAQNYHPLEIIIVDDGSTDDTARAAAGLGPDVRYLYKTNGGPSSARNAGLVVAKGAFMAFLDADDLWPADKLQIQVGRLLAAPELEVVLGRIQYVLLPGAQEPQIHLSEDDNSLVFIHLGSGVFRKSAFDKVGNFDETLRFSEDHDWFLRAREAGIGMVILKRITLHYRLHTGNMTREKKIQDLYLTNVLKKSLDRRRKNQGNSYSLPKFTDYLEE